eukprot:4738509-Amphidinium_carterae.1
MPYFNNKYRHAGIHHSAPDLLHAPKVENILRIGSSMELSLMTPCPFGESCFLSVLGDIVLLHHTYTTPQKFGGIRSV